MADGNISMNIWKLSTIGLLVIGVTALVTTFVVGQKSNVETGQSAKAAPASTAQHKNNAAAPRARSVAASAPERVQPSQATVEACNQYANDQVISKSTELMKDAGIGAVIGAAVGAAGGAIAGGGKGAGKGAAIGGIVGATGGTLFGLNENKANDEKYKAAYASCMHAKGFPA